MRRSIIAAGMIMMVLAACGASGSDPAPSTPTAAPLPGRVTNTAAATLDVHTPQPVTPLATFPLIFPTTPPDQSPTPARDCTGIFAWSSVEAIEFNRTTITQLEASFGQAAYRGGRPLTFRFEEGGCKLEVEIAGDVAQAAELISYGTLGLLLDRYGSPAVAGIAEGNLTLMLFGGAVLLYPDQGVIALFDDPPDDLTRMTPISRLQFRPPYTADQQITRLNLRVVEWQAPLR